jgi:hypothetical protein
MAGREWISTSTSRVRRAPQQPGDPCKSLSIFGNKVLPFVHSARIQASAFCKDSAGATKIGGAVIDEAFASVADELI